MPKNLYRVGRTADGLRWWQPGWEIPADVTDVRSATDAEAELMDKIVSHRNPPIAWGNQLARMMEVGA